MKTNLTLPSFYIYLFIAIIFIPMFLMSGARAQTINAYAVFSDSARDASQLAGTFFLNKLDTTDTAQLELMVGIAENDSSLLSAVVDFDNVSTLPQGFTYERTDDDVRIGVIGNTPAWTYYCRVRIKDNQGNWSQPFIFLAN